MEKLNDISLVDNYNLKGSFTNFYMLPHEIKHHIALGNLFFMNTEHNIYLFLKKEMCLRLYFYINDASETIKLPFYENYTAELIYQGGKSFPLKAVKYLEKCGFKQYLIRDYYTAMFSDMNLTIEDSLADIYYPATEEEVIKGIRLFNDSFDPYTGDYINEIYAKNLIEDHSMLIASVDGIQCGAIHFYEKNHNTYLGHLAVVKDARGKHIGRKLLEAMIRSVKPSERSRFSLWVQHQNTSAVNLYRNIGYKFTGKSSLSFLKLK